MMLQSSTDIYQQVRPLLVIVVISALGGGTLYGVFKKMHGGFGPFNLRVVGIVLVAILASLLAIAYQDTVNAAMGILGGIAGYLFGLKSEIREAEATPPTAGKKNDQL